jgi:hypothetical protein
MSNLLVASRVVETTGSLLEHTGWEIVVVVGCKYFNHNQKHESKTINRQIIGTETDLFLSILF